MSISSALSAALAGCLVLVMAPCAAAQEATGTLTITATVVSSIGLLPPRESRMSRSRDRLTVIGRETGPAPSSTLTLSIGDVYATGEHAVFAELQSEPAAGVVWRVNGQALSSSTAIALPAPDRGTSSYVCAILVPSNASARAIDNTIRLTAVTR